MLDDRLPDSLSSPENSPRSRSPTRSPSPIPSAPSSPFDSEHEPDDDDDPPPDSSDSSDEDNRDKDDGECHWGGVEETPTTVMPYRRLLASLDWEHHCDLAGHLYSVHLLKRQGSITTSVSEEGRSLKKLKPTFEEGIKESISWKPAGKDPFPRRQWTAWPLPPIYVPREAEHTPRNFLFNPGRRNRDSATYTTPLHKATMPSQMLEECILTSFLRISKESLKSNPPENRNYRSKMAKLRGQYKPAVDDGNSARLLKPIVRHVISKIDALLIGLYHDRVGYVPRHNDLDPIFQKPMLSRSAIKNKPKAQRAAERRWCATRKESYLDSISEQQQQSEKKPPAAAKAHPPKPLPDINQTHSHHKNETRDWSNLLGTASCIGWDSSAENGSVQAASRRCTLLFQQSMAWRRLRESDTDYVSRPGATWTSADASPPPPRMHRGVYDIDYDGEKEEGLCRDGFMMEVLPKGKYRRAKNTNQPIVSKYMEAVKRMRRAQGVSRPTEGDEEKPDDGEGEDEGTDNSDGEEHSEDTEQVEAKKKNRYLDDDNIDSTDVESDNRSIEENTMVYEDIEGDEKSGHSEDGNMDDEEEATEEELSESE